MRGERIGPEPTVARGLGAEDCGVRERIGKRPRQEERGGATAPPSGGGVAVAKVLPHGIAEAAPERHRMREQEQPVDGSRESHAEPFRSNRRARAAPTCASSRSVSARATAAPSRVNR